MRRRSVAAATEQVIDPGGLPPSRLGGGRCAQLSNRVCHRTPRSRWPTVLTMRDIPGQSFSVSLGRSGNGALLVNKSSSPHGGVFGDCIIPEVCPSFCGTTHWPIECNEQRVQSRLAAAAGAESVVQPWTRNSGEVIPTQQSSGGSLVKPSSDCFVLPCFRFMWSLSGSTRS